METPTPDVSVLHKVSNIVSSELSLDEMLGEVVGLSVQITGCDACLVYLFEQDTNEIVLRASQVPHAEELGFLRMKLGEGITGWVGEHKSVVALSSNASQDKRFKKFGALVEDTYQAFVSVPLVSGGDLIGVLNAHHRATHSHSQEEVATLAFIGEQMGGAIARHRLAEENMRLSQEATEAKRKLEERKVVERAKGILQRKHALTEEDAYLQLRNESRRLRRPMKDLAEAIIFTEELNRRNTAGEIESTVS